MNKHKTQTIKQVQQINRVTMRQQLWASVIEKAFAKACGSYEANISLSLYIYIYIYTYVCVYVCIYIYIYIYIYI